VPVCTLLVATVAATAEVLAVGATACGESAAPVITFGQDNVLRLRSGASPDAPDGSRSDAAHAPKPNVTVQRYSKR